MSRIIPAILTPATAITADLWNDQVGDNLNHLLGLTASGTALTDLTGGGEIIRLPPIGGVTTIQTRATTGLFTTIDLTTLAGWGDAYDVEISVTLRSNAAAVTDIVAFHLNGDTLASNYYQQRAGSNDGANLVAESADATMGLIPANTAIANSFAQGNFRIYNFKNSAIMKNMPITMGGLQSATASRIDVGLVTYRVASAITTVQFTLTTGTGFLTHSSIKVRFIV